MLEKRVDKSELNDQSGIKSPKERIWKPYWVLSTFTSNTYFRYFSKTFRNTFQYLQESARAISSMNSRVYISWLVCRS